MEGYADGEVKIWTDEKWEIVRSKTMGEKGVDGARSSSTKMEIWTEKYKDGKMDAYTCGKLQRWTYERWKYGWRSARMKKNGWIFEWRSTKMDI